mmetsp:Transcript_24946/g.77104  ORF Transcript_24946/g.77104 Transcript_24946/m.77104 type:complete len:214 (+) Transcript_24946:715-1356(+)
MTSTSSVSVKYSSTSPNASALRRGAPSSPLVSAGTAGRSRQLDDGGAPTVASRDSRLARICISTTPWYSRMNASLSPAAHSSCASWYLRSAAAYAACCVCANRTARTSTEGTSRSKMTSKRSTTFVPCGTRAPWWTLSWLNTTAIPFTGMMSTRCWRGTDNSSRAVVDMSPKKVVSPPTKSSVRYTRTVNSDAWSSRGIHGPSRWSAKRPFPP